MYDVAAFDPESTTKHATCSGKNFLCGAGADDAYGKCLKAVDCKMHHDMAVSVPSATTSKFATFARQMIPHHQNAVSMTKVLTKHHKAADYPAAGTEDQDMAFAEGLARDIINVQNRQTQQMTSWLEANTALSGVSTQCYADSPIGKAVKTSVGTHTVAAGAMKSGEACTPTGTTLKMKWNSHASEWGAYEITGCTGVNPKLSLAAGTEYTFDQSDASNWYHPVGFSYIAGGAHASCKLTGGATGECPELGGEAAGTTIQYYIDGLPDTSVAGGGFGLDAYEPLFFNSQSWWGEKKAAKAFKVTLKIPATAAYNKIYYFCHIHAGMSAEIEITGTAGTGLNVAGTTETQATALAIYTSIVTNQQKAIAVFDDTCGTYDVAAFDPESTTKHATC